MWRYGQNGMGAALGEVNSGVALGGRWDGSMGQQHGATRRPQVDIWNSAMFEFARSACLPISRTFRRVCDFQRGLRQPIASRIPLVASICPLRVISTASRLGCPSA